MFSQAISVTCVTDSKAQPQSLNPSSLSQTSQIPRSPRSSVWDRRENPCLAGVRTCSSVNVSSTHSLLYPPF